MYNRTPYVFTSYDPSNREPISTVAVGYTFTLDKSDKSNWIPVSKTIRKHMTKNEANPWLALIEQTGTGFITNLIKNLTLSDIIELMITSRRLEEILRHYIYYNDVTELSTRITDIKKFFKKMPRAKYCNYSGLYYKTRYNRILERIPSRIFEGRNLISLDLSDRDLYGFNPENLRGIKHLYLNRCTNVTNDLFCCLQGIKTLEFKEVKYPNINSEAFAYLVGIEHLSLANTFLGCNDENFNTTRNIAFSFLQGIKSLDVTDIEVDDNCLRYLDGIEKLNISDCTEITDIGIEYITRSGCLKELIMINCSQDTITAASHERLKNIPVLDMECCINNTEVCTICQRIRRIDKIQEHLETECNEICTFCDESYDVRQKDIHLNYYCTMNFLKCNDCHVTILQKNQKRHNRRCSMKMITCTWCSDTTKFAKKDWKIHVNMNYEDHELNMSLFIKSFPFIIIDLQHTNEMNKKQLLEYVNCSEHKYINDKYNFEIMRQEQHRTLMCYIISINRGNNIRKLLIQCTMMKELHKMCLKQKHKLKDMLEMNEYENAYQRDEYESQLDEYESYRDEFRRDMRNDM